MAKKLNENTTVIKDGSPVALSKGDEVPDWAADQVGDHLLEGGESDKGSTETSRGTTARGDKNTK